jgi:hypothetical protein
MKLKTVTIDGVTYAVGEPGDLVTLGDWDCDGHETPALLRPSTGAVFVFDRWATAADEITVPTRTVVPGAVSVEAVPDAAGCDRLVVHDGGGGSVAVPA